MIKIHKLKNGLTLVAQPMQEVSSAAFCFFLPAGAVQDPSGQSGAQTVLSELLFRGADHMDNRSLQERLDELGLQRHSQVALVHSMFSGALLGDNLYEVLSIYSKVLQKPALQDREFEPCRQLALQELESLEDDPRQKVSLLVKEAYLPTQWGRPAVGRTEDLKALTGDQTRSLWRKTFQPDGTILAVAGKLDMNRLEKLLEKEFSAWHGQEILLPEKKNCLNTHRHLPNKGAQVHVGLMYPSAHILDKDYYPMLAAVSVLSGGMSSRLFTEVREKRGLCYAVGARHVTLGPYGAVQCYLGSSPDHAQLALDVMVAELLRLKNGIESEELDRAKVGLRASLIMQGESTQARAQGCGLDYYYLRRVRPLEEIESAIVNLTVDQVLSAVARYEPEKFTLATIGPKKLELPKG